MWTNLGLHLAVSATEAAEIGAVVVVMAGVVLGIFQGELDLSEHEVIGLVLGGVGPENHFLDGVVFAGRLFAVGKPFDGEGRPFESVGDDEIVEERCVLFPDLVFFVYKPLFYLSSHLFFVFAHFLVCDWEVRFVWLSLGILIVLLGILRRRRRVV